MTVDTSFAGGLFPLGTHVYREPHQDEAELMADLPVLKRAGFNMIKIQECWSYDERREGEIDLSRIERIIARAGELGLGIYLGLTPEQAPAWLWRKYPDSRMVDSRNQPHDDPTQYCLPVDGKPGPCWDHDGAREAGTRFISELVKRLGRFQNIWCWNVWQEIGFWINEAGIMGFCYCPRTLDRFREWLRSKYDSLENLNAAWQSGYGEWDEVEPPRRHAFVPGFVDWRYFMDDVYITRALQWKIAAVRENDPMRRPVFSHVGGPNVGGASEWRWARTGDFWGNSNYPAWSGGPHGWDDEAGRRTDRDVTQRCQMWDTLMLRTEYCRSANGRGRVFWGAEFQGGPASTHLHQGRTPDASDIRRWMLSGLAAGMNGISFWNHRAEGFWSECNGFGLLDPRGETTERIEAAGAIGKAINEAPEVFSLGEPPRAETAILVNEDLAHFCAATGDNAGGHLHYAIRNYYGLLWRMGVAADFVDAEDVAAGALSHYRLAILPAPVALDGGYFAHLAAFVEKGGTLLSDACPGRFTRLGFCPRAQMVDGGEALFGAAHESVRICPEPDGQTRWTPPQWGWGEYAPPTVLAGADEFTGTRLRASFLLQTLTPLTARPVMTAGEAVAGTMNDVGDGRAILIGTLASHGAFAHRLDGGLFEKLAEIAGVTPDRCGPLLRRRRVHERLEAWFLINPTADPVSERVALDGRRFVRDLTGDAVAERSEDALTVTVPGLNAACVVLERQ